MREALAEAERAAAEGEVPVGAVIYQTGKIIARGFNKTEQLKDPCAHAEILAIRQACIQIADWRLNESILCVTLEPCVMCMGAIRLARIPTLIFGAQDPRMGACGSAHDLSGEIGWAGELSVISDILGGECSRLMKEFFGERRMKRDSGGCL
ncbi:MAG: tRNA-specific adenosine deaminase [Proteobacteria bacterium]|nr:MAG: tRNA-specific adenosine deaminase [Pseudomonadota bacterium]